MTKPQKNEKTMNTDKPYTEYTCVSHISHQIWFCNMHESMVPGKFRYSHTLSFIKYTTNKINVVSIRRQCTESQIKNRIMDNSNQDNSYPIQFVSRTNRTQDNSYPRQLVPKTTRTQDDRRWLNQIKYKKFTFVVDNYQYHITQYHTTQASTGYVYTQRNV